MVDSIEESTHTSAFDRVKGAKGQKVDSAAFDLVPVDREEQAKKLRETPVEELRREREQRNVIQPVSESVATSGLLR